MARPHVIGELADGTRCYAPIGRLLLSGDRVCCHLCGRWFLSVASHLRVHGWTKDAYLDAFGLERTNALRGEATRKRRAAAMAGRQVLEPAIRAAQSAARDRARSGTLASAAADAARGRRHPVERRRKTYAALGRISPQRQAAANARRGAEHVRRTAAAIAGAHGYSSFADYVRERTATGHSLASISRDAGQHKDWLARHLAVLLPHLDPAGHHADLLDARWPVDATDLPRFLRVSHVEQHRSVAAIAAEAGLSRSTVVAALRRYGIAVESHAGARHSATARDVEIAATLGFTNIADYVADRRARGLAWAELARESGMPETSLRRRAAS